VVGHDDEGVKLIGSGVAMTEEGGDDEFGVAVGLEDAATFVGGEGEGVGLWSLADGGRVEICAGVYVV